MRAKPQLPYCITILLGIILFHHSLLAQLSPLPLEVGNYWIFDRVLNEERTSAVGRIEVTGKIRVTPVEQDTLYWHHSDGAFGPTGEEYFTLRFSGRTRLFPGPGLDTLLVRSDSQGNLWSRGFVNKGITRIAKEDQPDHAVYNVDKTAEYRQKQNLYPGQRLSGQAAGREAH